MTTLYGPGEGTGGLSATTPHSTSTQILSPVQGLAYRAWQSRFLDTPAFGSLVDWQTDVAPDGRLLHTARVDCPHALGRIREFVNGPLRPVSDDQPRPFIDFSEVDELGRVSCLWLVDGQWVQLWAPEPQPPVPVPAPVPVGMTLAAADALLAAALPDRKGTPSGRLPYTRRSKTRKDHAA
ncbi:hypothetical protein AB0933_32690 [Streptomyces venezuelae]|uniref:hypothetical protein n=1 Tax=Streptomyces venezuelae TaxID=54571 RepID=UPI0034570818